MNEVLRAEVQALRAYIKRLEDAVLLGDLPAAEAMIKAKQPKGGMIFGEGGYSPDLETTD